MKEIQYQSFRNVKSADFNFKGLIRRKISLALSAWIVLIIICVILSKGLVLLIVSPLLFIYFLGRKNTDEQRLRAFADDNDFVYQVGFNPELMPKIVKLKQEVFNPDFVVTGQISAGRFDLYKLTYLLKKTDYGNIKSSHWVIHFRFNGSLPNFYIDARYNDLLIIQKMKGYTKLNLEGDFSEYYDLYCEKGAHIDVLSVISPDVMDALKEFWSYVDVVVSGDECWLIGTANRKIEDDIRTLFEAAETMLPEFEHRSRTFKSAN